MQAGDASVHMEKKVRDWLIGSICVTVFTVSYFLFSLVFFSMDMGVAAQDYQY
jgi:multidrug transporter EmrE-like cation transporter